ncbi:MAG: hypothetical protein ACRCVX_12550 [Shewanella sp.]
MTEQPEYMALHDKIVYWCKEGLLPATIGDIIAAEGWDTILSALKLAALDGEKVEALRRADRALQNLGVSENSNSRMTIQHALGDALEADQAPLERVARALYEMQSLGADLDPAWVSLNTPQRDPYIAEARAILMAIRKPNDIQRNVGGYVIGQSESGALNSEKAEYAFTAMIDAALKETPDLVTGEGF